jgi:hypothetical protein
VTSANAQLDADRPDQKRFTRVVVRGVSEVEVVSVVDISTGKLATFFKVLFGLVGRDPAFDTLCLSICPCCRVMVVLFVVLQICPRISE